jgi:hypothetical protein
MRDRSAPRFTLVVVGILCVAAAAVRADDGALNFQDPNPQRYDFAVRASAIDPRVRSHPEVDFLLEKDGKPQDGEGGAVDTRVAPRGRLVVWLMGASPGLFDRVTGYGMHAVHVHYARGWFGRFGEAAPAGDTNFLGKIRAEAATGRDLSPVIDVPEPDGMKERAHQLVRWLAKENPQGRWDYFLAEDGKGLRWDRVIVAGSSHGATTAARFAKEVRVDRVVMLCGPRDQFETWQGLPSATPANRFFGFSHVLDGGWTGGHYCRSWKLLALHEFGPIVNVDGSKPPYENTRRLVSAAEVGNDAKRAHGAVTPGKSSPKDPSGAFLYEDVWRYLFTHPVEATGTPVAADPDCLKELSRPAKRASKPAVP